jgi:4-oxalocrotonate tautomerase
MQETDMPHVIVKLYPGRSKEDKSRLAAEITKAVMTAIKSKEESISVGIEDVDAKDWEAAVYKPDILGKPDTIYKKPGNMPV